MEKVGLVQFLVLTGQNGTGFYLGKQHVIKCTADIRQRMEYMQQSSGPDGDMLTLCEDSTVKIIPVALAKDGMQLKPGLLYDTRQGKIIGSTLNLDYNYIEQGEPDNFGYDKE